MTENEKAQLNANIIGALKTVFDPEIPINIYDLGLIYDIEINNERDVQIKMTLTSPGCPVAQTFPETVQNAVCKVEDVNSAMVELIWEPPWTQARMSTLARIQLGWPED